VLNEGVDVPAIDRVVMLRPTESGVVFLQQLGRGLRAQLARELEARRLAASGAVDLVGERARRAPA
jgi:superfamily II DNA or RNA helicase